MKNIINYSGIPGLILISALFFLPVSCNKDTVKENPDADSSSQLIKISGEDANAATKTTLEVLATKWKVGDQVGVYCAQSSGGKVNIPYTASSAEFISTFEGAMKWSATNPHVFYAYYPYAGSAGSPAATVVPISLAAAQTQSAGGNSDHIGALDFLVATSVSQPPGVLGASTSVNLRYNHVFSVLEFQIKRSSGSAKVTKIKLTAPTTNLSLTSGTINITTATPGADVSYTISSPVGTKEITLTITDGVTPTADYATTPKIYMMILPGDFSSESMTIGIEYESSGIFINNVKTGINFKRGKKYVVQIDVPIDGDGNVYNTVTIGSQVWMASNLKTTKYNDGTSIPNVTDNTNWTGATTGAYCDYNNTSSNSTTYGRLYNWFAVDNNSATKMASNGGLNVCPTGWHVPTDAEWTTLTDYLTVNGYGYGGSGTQLAKSMAATSGWTADGTLGNVGNDQATNNSSGFTAVPGGFRGSAFEAIGGYVYWRSSTESSATSAWYRHVDYNNSSVIRSEYLNKQYGFSVRCLRD